jgi:phosphonate transport system permease protein
MTDAAASDNAAPLDALKADTDRLFSRKRLVGFSIPAVLLVYLTYIVFAFDVPGLMDRMRLDNAATLVADSYSYKTQVERDNRSGEISVAKEGERKGAYPEGMTPAWVEPTEAGAVVTLEDGHQVILGADNTAIYRHPDFGEIAAQAGRADGVTVSIPEEDLPEWVSYSSSRLDIRTEAGRMTMTRARTEVFRYFFGWELFWFTLDSPYHDRSAFEIALGPRLDAERANIPGALEDFWNNAMWRHKDVAWALAETVLMAFLGTMGAALVALPLAFLAAKNFTPVVIARQLVRRVFDFVRGVDALIWTIILSRAFGPGPLTGSLAILITDSGSFGKLFSEALENVDGKQIEGVASTGARPVQRYRFGVIPQVMPVLLSQVLYFLESNTRSATIIGAITGGGIGLMLTQAIQTQKDWEEVSYYIVLVILMVIAMDWLSGWLRGKLIGRSA